MNSFRNRAENNTHLGKLLLIRRSHRHAVENHVNRHAGKRRPLVHGHTEFLEGAQQLGIDLIHAVQLLFRFRRCVIAYSLKINLRILDVRPLRFLHLEPLLVGFEPKLEQPGGLILFRGNEPDNIFVKPFWRNIRLDFGNKTVFIRLINQIL